MVWNITKKALVCITQEKKKANYRGISYKKQGNYQFVLYKKNSYVQIAVFKSLSEMYEVLTGWETDLQFQIIECKNLAQEEKNDI